MSFSWSPDASRSAPGWVIEVPVRAADLPANLWLHWSGLTSNWGAFPEGTENADWHRKTLTVFTTLAPGDLALAGQASLAISSAHREEQGLVDTDDWGMAAADWVAPLQAPVVGPNLVVFGGQISTRGKCWPVGISGTIDLLILRSSLVPAEPPVHGAPRPKNSLATVSGAAVLTRERSSRSQLGNLLAKVDEGDQARRGESDVEEQGMYCEVADDAPALRAMSVQITIGPVSTAPPTALLDEHPDAVSRTHSEASATTSGRHTSPNP